ncbi:MAG: AMP-binding protein, partial [bacterium]|nr:AMP-binding protein [bacterium]
HERGEDVFVNIGYYTGIFKQETIQRLAAHLNRVIKTVVKEPYVKLKDIEIIPGAEKNRLLYEWNNTAADFPADITIPQIFEEQPKKRPDCIAVAGMALDDPGEAPINGYSREGARVSDSRPQTTHLTYNELNKKANRLAHLLMEKGIQPGTIVGVMAERSIEIMIAILGILKAGAGYLPVDPAYPEERIKYMLADSGAQVLLTDSIDTPHLSSF